VFPKKRGLGEKLPLPKPLHLPTHNGRRGWFTAIKAIQNKAEHCKEPPRQLGASSACLDSEGEQALALDTDQASIYLYQLDGFPAIHVAGRIYPRRVR